MDNLSALDPLAWDPEAIKEHPAYHAGNALGWLYRGDKQAATNYPLAGRLYLSKSGWLLLAVPNALVRGVFDAMSAPGAELPTAGVMNVPNVEEDLVNAHISVMNAAEVAAIGADKINERGHTFSYTLGALKEIPVKNVDGVSKIWAIQISSPGLTALRKSYGLSPLLNDHAFHITVAVRRKKVLQGNPVSKAAAEKQAISNSRLGLAFGGISNIGKKLGLGGIAKSVDIGRQSFRGPITTLGTSVPQGIFQREREQALQAGNEFLGAFKPQGFHVYAGRVKTPGSISGHGGTQITDDMLGFRLSSQQGYGQPAVDALTKHLTDHGVQVDRSKLLTRPGYHGWNIKGTYNSTPVEFQLSPRRLQGLSAASHSLDYKPHESGVIPAIGKHVYRPIIGYGMNVLSPMIPASRRVAYGLAGVGTMGTAGGVVRGTHNFMSMSPRATTPQFNNSMPPAAPIKQMPQHTNLTPARVPGLQSSNTPAFSAAPPVTNQLPMAKASAVYNFEGDVQGVSLRKTLHKVLDELKHPGLAYNNAHTGEAIAVLPGGKKKQQEILTLLRQRLADRSTENKQLTGRPGEAKYKKPLQEGVDYKITPRPEIRERMHDVLLSPEDVQKFIQTQGFNRLAAEHPEYQKQWLIERYRLQPNEQGHLTGRVPGLAKKQLLHGEPIYGYQLVPGWQDDAKPATTKTSSKTQDLLPGGEADHASDTQFAKSDLAEGRKHEREHTDNDQIAKEIAKDHLSEDPRYYKKVEQIEKESGAPIARRLRLAKEHSDKKRYAHKNQALREMMSERPDDWEIDDDKPKFKGVTHRPTKFRFHMDPTAIPSTVKKATGNSVYARQFQNLLNFRRPIMYDHSKPVFQNVIDHLTQAKERGDWLIGATQRQHLYRTQLDPNYRAQMARAAFEGTLPRMNTTDRVMQLYGNDIFDTIRNFAGKKS